MASKMRCAFCGEEMTIDMEGYHGLSAHVGCGDAFLTRVRDLEDKLAMTERERKKYIGHCVEMVLQNAALNEQVGRLKIKVKQLEAELDDDAHS